MIENRPWLTFISHLILAIGVVIVALPVYVTFVASTHTAEEVLEAPIPMLPGRHLVENYTAGLAHGAGPAPLVPVRDVAPPAAQGTLGPAPLAAGAAPVLDFYCSLRSPYTYLAAPRVQRLARHYGAELRLRFLLPMVMRGLPVPRAKRIYIVQDTKREAERLGMRFGRIVDPVGPPTERGLAVLHRAIAAGKGPAFLESFLQGVFADGIDAGTDAGLGRIAARAGLDSAFVAAALADDAWRAVAQANREELLALGLWGVPSFRVDARPAQWGQDRLWAIEEDLIAARRATAKASD
jgi:2-hydroxychromene-2-carboxylate isomerase